MADLIDAALVHLRDSRRSICGDFDNDAAREILVALLREGFEAGVAWGRDDAYHEALELTKDDAFQAFLTQRQQETL